MAVATAAWLLFLAGVCLTTANPVVVSQPQVAMADWVVTAAPIAGRAKRICIEKIWGDSLPAGEVDVLNLPENWPRSRNGRYLVPLSRVDGQLRVTTLKSQSVDRPPLVYPATDGAIAQMLAFRRSVATPARQPMKVSIEPAHPGGPGLP